MVGFMTARLRRQSAAVSPQPAAATAISGPVTQSPTSPRAASPRRVRSPTSVLAQQRLSEQREDERMAQRMADKLAVLQAQYEDKRNAQSVRLRDQELELADFLRSEPAQAEGLSLHSDVAIQCSGPWLSHRIGTAGEASLHYLHASAEVLRTPHDCGPRRSVAVAMRTAAPRRDGVVRDAEVQVARPWASHTIRCGPVGRTVAIAASWTAVDAYGLRTGVL